MRRLLTVTLFAAVALQVGALASTATMPNDSDLNNDGSVGMNLGMQSVTMHTGSVTYSKPAATTYTLSSAQVKYSNNTPYNGIQVKDRFFMDGFNVNLGFFGPVASSPEATITLAGGETRVSQWTVNMNYSPYTNMVVTCRSKFGSQLDYLYYLKTNSF